ncbi:hypothetical protein BS17DRAFT_715184 [Gyrodon lividus]|nr:hypothetical protein BS17DRAFT_715184 [Gyrodon lividus]
MLKTLKRKPQNIPADAPKPAKRQKTKDAPCISAQIPFAQKNLTLAGWMKVCAFIDSRPTITQANIIQHFSSLQTGALLFHQSTLSCKLRKHPKMEACINNNPTALSSKCPCVVTSPAVERALIHWVQHMENKCKTITGPMLWEKHKRFEEELQIPENEQLPGDGWLQLFCKMYKIWEHCRHGGAGSVDMEAVQVKQEHCKKSLAQYAPRDQWNFHETALFP